MHGRATGIINILQLPERNKLIVNLFKLSMRFSINREIYEKNDYNSAGCNSGHGVFP